MQQNLDRKKLINFLRGLAIFLVLWGHSIQYCCGGQFDFFENTCFKTIYSFHMPLFMIISGYLFFFSAQKRSMVELIEYKGKSILYPIIMCSAFNLVITKGIYSIATGEFRDLSSLLGGIGSSITSLWFLWSVLSCSIAVAIAIKVCKNPAIQSLLIIGGLGLVALFPCWEMNIYMYPYFLIGYVLAGIEERHKLRSINIVSALSTVMFVIMLLFFNKQHYIYISGILSGDMLESLKIDAFRWTIGLLGSISVIWICKLLFRFINKTKICEFIELMGAHSLALYALSVSLLSFWLPIIANKVLKVLPWINWNHYILLYDLGITLLIAIAYSILLVLIVKLLRRVGAYRLLFGR